MKSCAVSLICSLSVNHPHTFPYPSALFLNCAVVLICSMVNLALGVKAILQLPKKLLLGFLILKTNEKSV